MISTVGERDFCTGDLSSPSTVAYVRGISRICSFEFKDHLEDSERVSAESQLDHYCAHSSTPHFEDMTLLEFVQSYWTPKRAYHDLTPRL